MRPSWILVFAAALDHVVAGGAPPAECSEWAVWSTTTVYQTVYSTQYTTEYSTITDYVTVTQTETETDYKTITDTETNYVSVPGPKTTITEVNTVTETDTVTVPVTQPPVTVTNTITNQVTTTITNQVTVTQAAQTVTDTITNQVTVTQAAQTVTNTVTITNVQNVPQTIVQTVAQTVAQTVTAQVTAIVTSIVSSQCPTSLSGLVTCPSRIINPTYTTSTPLPSNYLWGCPPGSLCHPPRIDCNFEQNLPADSYYCSPDECQPVAELPGLDAFLAANQVNNNSCAFLTPADDYFNLDPLFLGWDFGIFNIYGQPTCSATTTACPAAPVCPAPETVTLVPVSGKNSWAPWSGPAYTGPPSTITVTAPAVTKRAELPKLQKRQGAPLIGYKSCYPACDYAGYVWQSIGDDPSVLCDVDGDWYAAYAAVTSCNEVYSDDGGPSRILSSLDRPRSICNSLNAKRAIGRRTAY